MATVVVARPQASRSSSEKDALSVDLKDASSSQIEVLQAPQQRRWFWQRRRAEDLDAIATQPSVFDDPTTRDLYRPPASYENAHRFDPDARWTRREEIVRIYRMLASDVMLNVDFQRIIRKIDWRVSLWAFIMFFSLDLDRINISQANTDNFLGDLHMNTDDFNLGNTLFRVSSTVVS